MVLLAIEISDVVNRQDGHTKAGKKTRHYSLIPVLQGTGY